MGFKEEHEAWIAHHLKRRIGERKDRLSRGHSYGEKLFLQKVWWPLFGQLNDLHPEYEVVDWRGSKFFVDLMLCAGEARVAFEIKGYGPHVEQADRTKYRRELNRELFLQSIDIKVVSIAVDELEENVELVKSFIRMIVGAYKLPEIHKEVWDSRVERDLIQLTMRKGRVIRPIDVVRYIGVSQPTALKYLKRLSENGKLRAIHAGKSNRVSKYEYVGSIYSDRFM